MKSIVSILIFCMLVFGCAKDVPSAEENMVDSVIQEMVNPKDIDPSKPLEAQGVSTVAIKNTLNFCKDSLKAKNKTIAQRDEKIEDLEDEISDLKEELAEAKEKSGQVDLLNKILFFIVLGFIGYLVFQLLPVIRKFFGV
jgi:hypothetical protein